MTKVEAQQKPNILIIFTDDQGYADLGCFGNTKNKTPRLDQLAKEGTRFTNFYAQQVCVPSRAALLSGRYPSRCKSKLSGSEITFAEVLKQAGYQAACFGKWDLAKRKNPILDRMPNAQGFDYFFGAMGANDNGIIHFHENNEEAGSSTDMSMLTRLYTDKAIDYLENKRNPNQPFVLYLAHTMMHTVIDASPKFKGKSKGGLFGDVVEEFDYETGRLLDKLDELGLTENTLVIYTTDNGPWCQENYRLLKTGLREYGGEKPEGYYMAEDAIFWGGKGSAYEAGSHVPCIVRWPGKVPAGRVSDALWATIDILPTLASIAGVEEPQDRVIDGINQTNLLLGKTNTGRESFIYTQNVAGVVGIRNSKWKLLLADRKPEKEHKYLTDFGTNEMELYDLSNDIGEKHNLIHKFPEIADEMKKELEKFIKDIKHKGKK